MAASVFGFAVVAGGVAAVPDAGALTTAKTGKVVKVAKAAKSPARRKVRRVVQVRPAVLASLATPSPTLAAAALPSATVATPPPDGQAALFLELTNAARAQARNCGDVAYAAVPPLQWDAHLAQAASQYAAEQQANGGISHVGRDGSTPGVRATRAGYAWHLVAENLAAGPFDAAGVVQAWLGSPGHCANIMSPEFRHMAMAQVGRYWSQELGAPR